MTLKRITILTLIAVSLYACNKNTEDSTDRQGDKSSVQKPSQNELKIKKLNTLNDNFKGFSTIASKAYLEYVGTFGSDINHFEPESISELLEVNAIDEEKLKYLDNVLEIPVLEELNSLITSYKINARAFTVAINSCQRYYSSKGYKKDNFENGKGMHKPIIEIYARFSEADGLLRINSNKILENLEVEHLNQLNKDGSEVAYLSIVGKNEAEKLNSLLTSKAYDSLDLDEITIFHSRIKNTLDKLKSLKASDAKQFNAKNIAYFDKFEEFYNAFDELFERKNEKKSFSKDELNKLKENKIAASSVEGSSHKVIVKYEAIMKSYNKNIAKL